MQSSIQTIIDEKLKLHEMPEVLREIAVNELSDIIIKRMYVDIATSLSEEDAERINTLMEIGDFDNIYGLLTASERNEKIALNAAEEVLDDFIKQLTLTA